MYGLIFKSNDEARLAIADAGVTVENVTDSQLDLLHKCIDFWMKQSGNYENTYKMDSDVSKFMTCQCRLWEGREAISFNSNGFIGIAGWASTSNAAPIYQGVAHWLQLLEKANPHQYFHLKNYLESGNKNTANGVSHVQRTCGIGYNNAMRTIDLGVAKGVLEVDKIHAHQHRIMEGIESKITTMMAVPAELLGKES